MVKRSAISLLRIPEGPARRDPKNMNDNIWNFGRNVSYDVFDVCEYERRGRGVDKKNLKTKDKVLQE